MNSRTLWVELHQLFQNLPGFVQLAGFYLQPCMVFVGQKIVGIVREGSLNERRSLFFIPSLKGQAAELRFRLGVFRIKFKNFGKGRSGAFGLSHLFINASKPQTRAYTSWI